MMKFLSFAPLSRASLSLTILLAAPSLADQLIQIPTADRTAGPSVEYKHRADGPNEGYGTLQVPVGGAYELMFRKYNNLDLSHDIEGGGQIQLLPDGVVTPGVAVGIWDLSNSSPWGRRGFLVLSKSVEEGQFGLPRPLKQVQLTLGTGTGRFSGLLAALRLDLPLGFSLITEHDGRRLNAGLWLSPVQRLVLKAEVQNGEPFVGAEARFRF